MILEATLLSLFIDGIEDGTDVWMVARRDALLAIRNACVLLVVLKLWLLTQIYERLLKI
jgi:hypothetical protein